MKKKDSKTKKNIDKHQKLATSVSSNSSAKEPIQNLIARREAEQRLGENYNNVDDFMSSLEH